MPESEMNLDVPLIPNGWLTDSCGVGPYSGRTDLDVKTRKRLNERAAPITKRYRQMGACLAKLTNAGHGSSRTF